MSDQISRGAEWRRWDLHVHSPASLVQNFGPDTQQTWDRYIDELEALPSELSVIGINDYWFLDGYRKVLEAKSSGRLKNLEAIFPVVEMRLEQFGGTGSAWDRVNLHVVFDPELGPDVIEQQFINALSNQFQLAPGHTGSKWGGAVTRASLADFGKKIKDSVPPKELKHYGSDIEEGFNNLVVPLGEVKKLLANTYLHGRALVGVGKAEWASIKWAGGSIASKKTIINYADFIFTASQDLSTWPGMVEGLREAKVNHKLLDCSDAHNWSDSSQNERLGRCGTWICASPTFAGLSHALNEFDDRVFVGLEPAVLARVRRHPQHFIDEVTIGSSDPGKYAQFSYTASLNSGFVAVIGNKGQGKSALLDLIALAGNSARTGEFAFLNPRRFLSPANRTAKEYRVDLLWCDKSTRRRGFVDGHDASAQIQVEYLPQAFVERLCTSDPRSADDDEFETELRAILFTHIPEGKRDGERSFDALLSARTRSIVDKIESLRRDLALVVERYTSLARFRGSNSIADVIARIATKSGEIEAAKKDLEEASTAFATLEIEGRQDAQLTSLTEEASRLGQLANLQRQANDALMSEAGRLRQGLLKFDSLNQRLTSLSTDAASINAEALELVATLPDESGVPTATLVSLHVDRQLLDEWRARVVGQQTKNTQASRDSEQTIEQTKASLAEVTGKLSAHDGVRELARQRVIQCEERVKGLIGDKTDDDSLVGLQLLQESVIAAPDSLKDCLAAMMETSRAIHLAMSEQLVSVSSLYEPAAEFISGSKAVDQAELEFKAELRPLPSLSGLAAQIDGRRSSELGILIDELPGRIEATSWDEVEREMSKVVDLLTRDRGQVGGSFRDPSLAMRSASTVEGLLGDLLGLDWLEVRFGLTGGGLPLSQLSPGQRGLILALFYLVVDRRETPLLLDQPEENLDNETITSLLVPALREAAGRRQTIVVTHNANLAVVGDADQIIHCELVDGVFNVSSGCISELGTAQLAVDVLEGTMPSFSNRQRKWEVFPELSQDI